MRNMISLSRAAINCNHTVPFPRAWTCIFHESHTRMAYAMSYFHWANMWSKLMPRENKYQTKQPEKRNSTSTSLFERRMEKSESQSKRKFAWISPAAITRRCCVCACVWRCNSTQSPIRKHCAEQPLRSPNWCRTRVGDTGLQVCNGNVTRLPNTPNVKYVNMYQNCASKLQIHTVALNLEPNMVCVCAMHAAITGQNVAWRSKAEKKSSERSNNVLPHFVANSGYLRIHSPLFYFSFPVFFFGALCVHGRLFVNWVPNWWKMFGFCWALRRTLSEADNEKREEKIRNNFVYGSSCNGPVRISYPFHYLPRHCHRTFHY